MAVLLRGRSPHDAGPHGVLRRPRRCRGGGAWPRSRESLRRGARAAQSLATRLHASAGNLLLGARRPRCQRRAGRHTACRAPCPRRRRWCGNNSTSARPLHVLRRPGHPVSARGSAGPATRGAGAAPPAHGADAGVVPQDRRAAGSGCLRRCSDHRPDGWCAGAQAAGLPHGGGQAAAGQPLAPGLGPVARSRASPPLTRPTSRWNLDPQ